LALVLVWELAQVQVPVPVWELAPVRVLVWGLAPVQVLVPVPVYMQIGP